MPATDLRRVPNTYRRSFSWILKPIARIQRDPKSLVRRPATTLARFAADAEISIQRQLDEHGPDGFVRNMLLPIANLSEAECREASRRLAREIEADRRRMRRMLVGAELLTLLDASNAAVKNSSLLVIPNPELYGRAALAAHNKLAAVVGTRGEIRATAILEAIHVAWEGVYQSYLQALWKLWHLGQAKAPGCAPSKGRLMQALLGDLAVQHPRLVEPEALRFRNAWAHQRFKYLPKAHSVTLSNKDGWTETRTVPELEATMCRMVIVSTQTFSVATRISVQEGYLRPILPIFPAFARAVVANNQDEVDRTGLAMKLEMDRMMEDIVQLWRRESTKPNRRARPDPRGHQLADRVEHDSPSSELGLPVAT